MPSFVRLTAVGSDACFWFIQLYALLVVGIKILSPGERVEVIMNPLPVSLFRGIWQSPCIASASASNALRLHRVSMARSPITLALHPGRPHSSMIRVLPIGLFFMSLATISLDAIGTPPATLEGTCRDEPLPAAAVEPAL